MLRQWSLVSLFQNDLSYYDLELWFVNSVRSLTLMDNKWWWALWAFKVPATNIRWYSSSVQIISTSVSVEWIILDNSNHSSTESFGIVWGRLMASEKQYLILLQWNTSEVNRASESEFDLRISLQKNNVKIRFYIFAGLLLCCLYWKEDFCCWRKNWDCLFCFLLIVPHYWDHPNSTQHNR